VYQNCAIDPRSSDFETQARISCAIVDLCREAKETLSAKKQVEIDLTILPTAIEYGKFTITRDFFDSLCKSFFGEVENLVGTALGTIDLLEIHDFLLVEGSCKLSAVRKCHLHLLSRENDRRQHDLLGVHGAVYTAVALVRQQSALPPTSTRPNDHNVQSPGDPALQVGAVLNESQNDPNSRDDSGQEMRSEDRRCMPLETGCSAQSRVDSTSVTTVPSFSRTDSLLGLFCSPGMLASLAQSGVIDVPSSNLESTEESEWLNVFKRGFGNGPIRILAGRPMHLRFHGRGLSINGFLVSIAGSDRGKGKKPMEWELQFQINAKWVLVVNAPLFRRSITAEKFVCSSFQYVTGIWLSVWSVSCIRRAV
jgi:hypothetical protein